VALKTHQLTEYGGHYLLEEVKSLFLIHHMTSGAPYILASLLCMILLDVNRIDLEKFSSVVCRFEKACLLDEISDNSSCDAKRNVYNRAIGPSVSREFH
jgi:hypothetical protein